MVLTFRCDEARQFFEMGLSRQQGVILTVATRKLAVLHAATELRDLRSPSRNRLEPLQGKRAGRHNIRIDDQWCVCLARMDAGPEEVEIVDYH